jgi:diguanylate cyclase (GGDEF)-like protein/PAS domain S-box-containing protein
LIFEELSRDRFGDNKYGYFWIHDLNYTMLMHPINPELIGKDLSNFTTLDDKKIFVEMGKLVEKQGSGYIDYSWYRPDNMKIDKKVSFIHILKEWNVILGAGFYLTELNEILLKEKNQLKTSLYNNLEKIFFVLLVLFVFTLLIARYISKRIEKIELRNKEQLNMLEQYKMVLDENSVVSKSNLDGTISYINDNFSKVSGYSKDEVLGATHSIIRHPDTPKRQFSVLWKTIESGKVWKGIIKNKNKEGNSYYNSTTIVPLKDHYGNIIEYISSGTDVTELIENRTKLQSLFKTDPLTGLGNRVNLINIITKKEYGVLALINIDRFREINDSFNHHIGDELIKLLADRLFDFFGEKECHLYRVQADVFAIFSIKKSQKEVLQDIEIFMGELGSKPYFIEDNKFTLTYTCGIASNSDNLLTFADIALCEAKNRKVKIKEYDNTMKNIEEFKNNLQWVEKLNIAIKEDRIVPYFQPIYNYKTKKIDKYEALMRLIEDNKVVYPNEYLDIAKKTKLYPELTYKMVEKVITKFSTNNLEFSINLCIEDLMNEDLISFISDYAEQKNVFNRMVLEIVESEEIDDSDSVSKVIKKFKEKGVRVAIDDFGSGYSNYEYLISLHADYIKIDGSITKFVLEDERTKDVIKSIVEFAKKSNMKVIAEYVSSKEIDECLKEIGVDYAQGYYYGKAEKDLI